MPSPPAVRVIIRLPYNRPEDAPPDPPRVEWNAEKEQILWEVIAKSRAIEGAGTDWQGLATHLQVPLPYILYRAQARYEQDLRGLQGLGTLGIRSAVVPFPSAPSPQRANTNGQGEYFPRVPDSARPPLPHRDSTHARLGSSSSANGGVSSTSGTVPGTSTLRPLGVRARLSSLGSARAHMQLRSPVNTEPVHSPLSGLPTLSSNPPRPSKKVSSSSTLTLQGPRRVRSPLHTKLSPTSSRAGSSSEGDGDDLSGSDDSDEEARKAEEAERQEMLTQKLRDLEKMMTKDTLGLVVEPSRAGGKHRGRPRPSVAASGASLSSLSARQSSSLSRSQGHQSLSSASVDSRQGSIPSIPSPPAHASQQLQQQLSHMYPRQPSRSMHAHVDRAPTHSDSHPHSLSTSQSLSQSRSTKRSSSNPQSPPRVTSPKPVPRHLSTPEKSSSPPALSPGRAVGQTHVRNLRQAAAGLAAVSTGNGTASEASSFSDLSDADLSGSALESALMSNTRGGSRLSSFARSHMTGGRRATRG
ncbi:hypothetical protein C8Q77DRAFT_449785 [Trametes polyzona]|nr:hypothetical protein C8Q77DRAFT_449785 [Trametes polyzona]